ncbi:MAG TPA: LytTR family DNA-binding domain-containing protein [Terriglobia bacterium]|nr:LytTR family DNA-binding domain-containing protein [Terriglobia bacterium]
MKAFRLLLVTFAAGSLLAQTRLDSNQMRNDLFAALAGNADALKRMNEASSKVLAANPDHAQALLWHGTATLAEFFMDAQKGKAQSGMGNLQKGTAEMDRAVLLAPNDLEVRIMRAVLYAPASRQMPDQYALEAFKVNSIDYLLKPFGAAQLERALNKLDRLLAAGDSPQRIGSLLEQVRSMLTHRNPEHIVRIASRVGDRVEFIEVANITHFFAKDKLTFAVQSGKEHAVDLSISELEQRLPPKEWVRIHRSTLLNIIAVKEVHSWFGGKLLIRLKDGRTELKVARERTAEVRANLGL